MLEVVSTNFNIQLLGQACRELDARLDLTHCWECGADNLRDYPLCKACAVRFCFPFRSDCEAAKHDEGCKTLRLQETVRVFADDPPRLADFLSDRMAA